MIPVPADVARASVAATGAVAIAVAAKPAIISGVMNFSFAIIFPVYPLNGRLTPPNFSEIRKSAELRNYPGSKPFHLYPQTHRKASSTGTASVEATTASGTRCGSAIASAALARPIPRAD